MDPVQPSEEEIQELIKSWEKENKKIKNPPPMPDFRAPKMIKAPLVINFFNCIKNYLFMFIFFTKRKL